MRLNRVLEDELQRGFQLACFLHADEPTALRVLTRAVEKLQVASATQHKRLYYKPLRHRFWNGHLNRLRTKAWLSDLQLLQRLIYIESETFERQSEERGAVSLDRLVVHYVKHLVRITMKRNAFHVSLGIGRILHNYTTAETMAIDERIGDGDRFRDDSYYRSRKAKLMLELRERFPRFLGIGRGARGEERFESLLSAEPYTKLVRRCLEHFTPWSTTCPAFGVNAMNDELDHEGSRSEPDEAETARMHAVLHPSCYDRLTHSLSLAAPDVRLQIPAFDAGAGNAGRPGGSQECSSRLEEEKVEEIRALLIEQGRRRKVATAERMRVIVDGVERASLDAVSGSRVALTLPGEAELIEVVADGQTDTLLLATHLLIQDDRARSASITLEGGQKIVFSTSPGAVEIAYRETSLFRRWQKDAMILRPAWIGGALASIAIVLLFVAPSTREDSRLAIDVPRHKPALVTTPSVAPALARAPADEGDGTSKTITPVTAAVDLDRTRDAVALPSASLAHTRTICIEVRDGGELTDAIAAAVRSRLEAQTTLAIAGCDDATVALKIAGREAVTVKLVDASGEILWSHAKYKGSVESIAAAIAADVGGATRARR